MKRFIYALLIVAFSFFPFCRSVHASVVINEFLPNPSGDPNEDSEWIELYSSDSDQVDISGWKLDDADGGSHPYIFASGSAIIPGGFLVFEKSLTNIALNNSGDTVRLLDASDQIKDSYTYTQTNDDITIGRSGNGGGSWTACASQTKCSSNNCPLPTATSTNSPAPTTTTASATPTLTPASVPTVALSLAPTKTPTQKISLSPTSASPLDILGSSSTQLGAAAGAETDSAISDIAHATSAASNMRPLIIALLLVAIGLALLTGVLVWQKKDIWKSISQKQKSSQ